MLRNKTMFCIAVLAGLALGKKLHDNRQESEHDRKSENEEEITLERQIVPEITPEPTFVTVELEFTIGYSVPEPIFNADDNAECQFKVNTWYDAALEYNTRVQKIDLSYADVLMRQNLYGIELTNN